MSYVRNTVIVENTYGDQRAEVKKVAYHRREQLLEGMILTESFCLLFLEFAAACLSHVGVRIPLCPRWRTLLLIRALVQVLIVRRLALVRVQIEQLPSHRPQRARFSCV